MPSALSKPRNLASMALCLYVIVSAVIADATAREPLVNAISPYVLSLLICAWVQADSREKRKQLCYDYDSFTFFVWICIRNKVSYVSREKRKQLCYDYDSFTFFVWPILTPIY